MNEGRPLNGEKHDGFPLARRPSSAVEKSAPGAKRILSGMVADALALKKKSSPRIIVVDDEPLVLEAYEILIRKCCPDAILLKFDNGDPAWEDIMRTTPDLLITDMNRAGLSGWKMLPMLAAKKVKFPILIVSASAERGEVKQFTESELTVSILSKPLELEDFRKALESALKIRIPRDPTDTRKVAHAGDVESIFNRGITYYSGDGVPLDYTEAAKCFRIAAEQNHIAAQFYLGWCYEKGHGVSQSYEQAVRWYRKAADQGNPEAQCNLSVCYFKGHGVPQDYEQAVQWERKAVEQGNPLAENNLGCSYRDGKGVQQDYAEAAGWFRKAAEKGNVDAQINLGWCYEKGHAVPQDYGQAVQWLHKAVEQGHPHAQCNLGICYYRGQGVPRDYALAVQWFRKAAEQGHAGAQFNLGVCYKNGSSVKKNLPEAFKWFKLAAEQDGKRGVGLARLLPTMTPEQLQENERGYQEFNSLHRSNTEKAAELPVSKRRGKLLIVDDEDGPRQSLRVIFQNEYDLFFAEDGPTAIKLVQENDIDVVVTNIRMAGMSGIEVLERVKSMKPDIEVIIMTAYETTETLLMALRLRACDYFNKPFDLATMRAAVSKAMQRHILACKKSAAQKKSSSNLGKVADLPVFKRRGRLLIVDGEDGPRLSCGVIFKQDYDLFFAEDGVTAIEQAMQHDIDVVVLDTLAGLGMSGLEVLERLKILKPDIEVIIMTAYETTDTIRRALQLRACDYFNKPFDLATMRAAVSKAMKHHTP